MIPFSSKTRISVVRGGDSTEFECSLATGAEVLKVLREMCDADDIVRTRSGEWLKGGVDTDLARILQGSDVVFNALHGGMGENGDFQQILRTHHKNFTGSDALASALSLSKKKSRELFSKHGIRSPRWMHAHVTDPLSLAGEIFRKISSTVVIKDLFGGASEGVHYASSYQRIANVLADLVGEDVIVEEYITGTPVSVGVVNGMRDEDVHVLIPVAVNIESDPIYYHNKRSEYSYSTPPYFSRSHIKELQDLAQAAHELLGLHGYSQSDFVVSPIRGVYLLETNALPTLTDDALYRHGLDASGIPFERFLAHIINLALQRR